MKGVSFIIPNYNAERTIEDTINSILKQKSRYKFEVIVIDDNSKDSSLRIIKKFSKNKKLRIIKNKKNLGLATTLNKGIKISKYDYIAIIWCDCELVSDKWLDNMIKVMDSNNNIAVVRSNLFLPREIWESYDFWNKLSTLDQYIRYVKKIRFERPTMFRKEILAKFNYYDNKTFRIAGEDTDLCIKISKENYLMPSGKTDIIHKHGMYNLSLIDHLFKKALPLAEAAGVIFRKHFFVGNKLRNGLVYSALYLLALIPSDLNKLFMFLILILALIYTLRALFYIKLNIRLLFLPLFKILKDLISIFGFWKGFITGKQEF